MVTERRPGSAEREVRRLRGGAWSTVPDPVATEEPLEIRLVWESNGVARTTPIAVTMRTPGNDFELAAGFLFSETIVRRQTDIVDVAYCLDDDVEAQEFNVVSVTLAPGTEFDPARLERHFYVTSSCGVCGKAALETLEVRGCEALPDGFEVPAPLIQSLPGKLRAEQRLFDSTGGLHAAGLFDAAGRLDLLREDVGRHNAVDKLVGRRLLDGLPGPSESVLMLSGRASFELLQKALVARIPVVAAVGAPSSLAVDLAHAFNITLLGFVREDGLNVYAGGHRLIGG